MQQKSKRIADPGRNTMSLNGSQTTGDGSRIQRPIREVGIAGYGAYLPRYRLRVTPATGRYETCGVRLRDGGSIQLVEVGGPCPAPRGGDKARD